MEREGVLEPARIPGRTAKGYRLAAQYQGLAQQARVSDKGRILDGANFVAVGGKNLARLLHLLSDVAESPHFRWATRLAGPGRVLLCFSRDGRAEVERLRVIFEREGFDVTSEEAVASLDARELREWTADRLNDRVAAELDGEAR
jgi:hypothetical protein